MPDIKLRSTARLRGMPLHAMLVPVPIVCFIATLVTDIVYWRTAAMLWADISAWLLVIGLIFSVFAATAGLIDFFGNRRIRELRGRQRASVWDGRGCRHRLPDRWRQSTWTASWPRSGWPRRTA